ncbi:MAG: tetratricopeptide repeat protein [Hyphomicrobiaceae bacterium]|nr:tetratricopeptide repeat protein [Hyphomicrobiaceae bacterium]
MRGAGLEDRPAVEEAHLARIKDAIGIESQRIKEIEAFMPGGSADAKISEYDDAIKITGDVMSDAKLLSDYLRERGHGDLAGRIDGLRSDMRRAAFTGMFVPKAVLLCETNRGEEAIKCLEGERGQCDSPDVAVRLGAALAEAGLHDDAYEWIDRAIEMDPGHPAAAYNMALLEDDASEYHDASERLDWVLDAKRDGEDADGMPDLNVILLRRGLVHAHVGDHKSAIECYDEALEIRPSDPDMTYHKAESLYRTGECAKAIEWFGRVSGHRDADAMRERIDRMQNGPDERVLLPLLVIGASKGITGMPHLQYAASFVQLNMGMHAYDFARQKFGPYSADLADDVSANTGLFEVGGGWNRDPMKPRTYSITARGREVLEESGLLGKAASCNMDVTWPNLVDATCSKLSACIDIGTEADLRDAIDTVRRRDELIPHTHGWVETEADHVKHVLSDMGSYSLRFRPAILNIAGIVADKCSQVQDLSMPPVKHYALDDALSTLWEYGNVLMEYCEMHKMHRITFHTIRSNRPKILVNNPSRSGVRGHQPS